MTTSSYLNICVTVSQSTHENEYTGRMHLNNKLKMEYDHLALFIEGVHQFCVRSSLKHNSEKHLQLNKKQLVIPAKIKEFCLFSHPNCDTYLINGSLQTMNNFSLVAFQVSKNDTSIVAKGQIYVVAL